MNIHEIYIKRCIDIAKNGMGTTAPNPLVGSVITYRDKIIGEGWHSKSGEAHAEVIAIGSVKDKAMLKKATIYVNLEPCNHYGRTPPCTDLIIASGISDIIVGTLDPSDEVSGKGVRKLMEAGCAVTVGILATACHKLNKRFFTFHTKKRPYIILKWAESADGFLGKGKPPENLVSAKPQWISNLYSRQHVHKWRTEEAAILAGTTTILHDNPKLNARDWKGNTPVRVILDKQLKIPKTYAVWDGSIRTIFVSDRKHHMPVGNGVENISIDFSESIPRQLCEILYKNHLQSVLIEGGAKTLHTFIEENLWDEARVFKSSKAIHNGIRAPRLDILPVAQEKIIDDTLSIYKYPHKKYNTH